MFVEDLSSSLAFVLDRFWFCLDWIERLHEDVGEDFDEKNPVDFEPYQLFDDVEVFWKKKRIQWELL